MTPQDHEREPPLFVHLTRMAGLLTLLGGIVLLVAANAVVGICIVLLSALYFALAEIISYLAIIARRNPEGSFAHEAEEIEDEVDVGA